MQFERNTFQKRMKSMLAVDMRRMFLTPFIYIVIAACLVMPIVILVMTTMMDGTVTVDPQTGAQTVIKGFDNTWQIIGAVSKTPVMGGEPSAQAMAMDMNITSMCNINMLYFLMAVPVCLFVSQDFTSGYAKNLFTVRAKKTEYILSKTIVGVLGGILMLLAFFVGAVLGGKIAGLPFTMEGFTAVDLVFCLLCKLALSLVFVPIYLVMSTAGKGRAWLSLLLSFAVGMFLFMMIPMMSPLNATPLHLLLCLAGGGMFCLGLGAVGRLVLQKTALV